MTALKNLIIATATQVNRIPVISYCTTKIMAGAAKVWLTTRPYFYIIGEFCVETVWVYFKQYVIGSIVWVGKFIYLIAATYMRAVFAALQFCSPVLEVIAPTFSNIFSPALVMCALGVVIIIAAILLPDYFVSHGWHPDQINPVSEHGRVPPPITNKPLDTIIEEALPEGHDTITKLINMAVYAAVGITVVTVILVGRS